MEGRKKKDRQIGERVVMGKERWMDRRMGREVNGQKAGVDTRGDGWKNVLLSDGLFLFRRKDGWMSG